MQDIKKQTEEALKNPVVAETVATAAGAPGAGQAVQTAATATSNAPSTPAPMDDISTDKASKEPNTPSPEQSKTKLEQSRGLEETTQAILENYSGKTTEFAKGAITSAAKGVTSLAKAAYSAVHSLMSPAPDTPKPTELSNDATSPLKEAKQTAEAGAPSVSPELNPEAGQKGPSPL
jgi:hypothetical protein